MSNCQIDITNRDDTFIANELRRTAYRFDPWGAIRPKLIAFIFGCIFIASLDYGDVWICVGKCGETEAIE
jgi:hypothetical protein